MTAFPARYAGNCGGCGERINPGDTVAYTENDELIGQECCGDADEIALVAVRPARDDASRVMPRGKTVRDRCGECFQIPAANGACGCEVTR